jgi:hypothetical protein
MQIVTRTVAFGAMLSVLALTFAANAGEMISGQPTSSTATRLRSAKPRAACKASMGRRPINSAWTGAAVAAP